MHSPHRQKGMSAIGWLLVAAIAGMFALVLIKLTPVYIEGFDLGSAMHSLANDAEMRGKSPRELQRKLMSLLDLNSIYDIHAEDIQITRSGNGYTIEVDYEPQVKLFGNLYFLVIFDKSVTIPASVQ